MNQSQLDHLYTWFDGYVEPFLNTDAEGAKNIRLKIEHTQKVCGAMAQLAEGENLSEAEARTASAVALLHDIGRFPQYRRWRTFLDRESDNHARLGIDVIRSENILTDLDRTEQDVITEAIRFHNLLATPATMTSPTRLHIDLIRDADKLDIWRVFVELLAQPPEQRASAALLGLPDCPGMASGPCIKALAADTIVRLDTINCINDFILLQISWVHDLTTATSRQLLRERGYITTLASHLPDQPDIRAAVAQAVTSLSA